MNRKRKPGNVHNVTKATKTRSREAREATHRSTPKQKRSSKSSWEKTWYITAPNKTKMISDYEQCEAMGKNISAQNNLIKKDKQQQITTNMTKTPNGQVKRSTKKKPWRTRKKQQTQQKTQQKDGKGKGAEEETTREEKHNSEASRGESGKENTDKTNNAMEDYLGEYGKIPSGKGKRTTNRHSTSEKHEKIWNIRKKTQGEINTTDSNSDKS